MVEIDGSRYSGSGTIVRQAVVLAALTGRAVHIVNARMGRPKAGLRPQHVRVVEAIRQLVNGQAEGVHEGSQELLFTPGEPAGDAMIGISALRAPLRCWRWRCCRSWP